jgi:hypothetical protein
MLQFGLKIVGWANSMIYETNSVHCFLFSYGRIYSKLIWITENLYTIFTTKSFHATNLDTHISLHMNVFGISLDKRRTSSMQSNNYEYVYKISV